MIQPCFPEHNLGLREYLLSASPRLVSHNEAANHDVSSATDPKMLYSRMQDMKHEDE